MLEPVSKTTDYVQVKITDFGLARAITTLETSQEVSAI